MLLTASTTAWLWGMYSAYAIYVSPIVEPPPRHRTKPISMSAQMSDKSGPLEHRRLAERYLAGPHPSEKWTLNSNYSIKAHETFIYAQKWDREGASAEIRFKPFAMIWMRPDAKPKDAPLVFISDAAVIRFASQFDAEKPQPGRIVGGSLEGNVRIEGADGLSVVGRNFIFDEGALGLWSDSDQVKFTYGPHRGQGHGLQIDFLSAPPESVKDRPAVSGISRIMLRRDVKLELAAPDKSSNRSQGLALQAGETATVTCQNSFQYQLDKNLMTLEKEVRVVRPTTARQQDTLTCDQLSIMLKTTRAANTTNMSGWLPKRLEVERLIARAEADKPVVLTSPANRFTGKMRECVYEPITRTVILRDPNGAWLKQETHELRCPEITLVQTEAGEMQSATCRGKGRLLSKGAESGDFAASWANQLRVYDEGDLRIVELDNRALVRHAEEMSLGGGLIKLWLSRLATAPAKGAKKLPSKKSELAQLDGSQFQIEKLVAEQDVEIVSPQLEGHTARMEVVFESPAPPPKGAAGNRSHEAEPTSPHPPLSRQKSHPTSEPFEVWSDRIDVKMVRDPIEPKKSEPREIQAEGSVRVVQEQPKTPDSPLELQGESLHVDNRGEGDQFIGLHGAPAHIRGGGMHLEGGEAYLDRKRNHCWVEGPGLLQRPIKSSLDGKELDEPQMLDVFWKEKMDFDGETAKFFEGVRATVKDSTMKCHTMTVELSKPVSFTDNAPRNGTEEVSIKKIECREGVDIDDCEYLDNKLVSIRRGKVAEFTVNQDTGLTQAQGPGWIVMWRRATGNRSGLGAGPSMKPNRKQESSRREWEYTRIDFSGKMQGNIHERFTKFHERVKVVYGPVERSTDILNSLDPTELPEFAGVMTCNTLQLTQHPKTDTQDDFVQVLATGNVDLAGQNFSAMADDISYDESKQLYVLSSRGKQKAQFFHQMKPGAEWNKVISQRIEFCPTNNKLISHGTTGLDALPISPK
ncbi:MAG TPA: hypothetical protein VHB77_05545 [Planctomycetaceae bacterium]|nr:hypothetical protein [Planctomycetaceae bacterium]